MNWAERIITEQNIISYLRSLTSREWIETMTRILPLFPEPDQAELREVLFRVMSGEARRARATPAGTGMLEELMKKLSKRKQAKMKENARKHAQRLSDEINRAWENGAYMGLPKHKFTERLKKIDEDRRRKGPIK